MILNRMVNPQKFQTYSESMEISDLYLVKKLVENAGTKSYNCPRMTLKDIWYFSSSRMIPYLKTMFGNSLQLSETFHHFIHHIKIIVSVFSFNHVIEQLLFCIHKAVVLRFPFPLNLHRFTSITTGKLPT